MMTNSISKPNVAQQQALQSLEEYRQEGNSKALVVMPSGLGKTRTAAYHVLEVKPKTVLYLVHKNEIIDQAAKEFGQTLNLSDDKIGYIDAENKDFDKPVIFATVQTLSRKANLDKLSKKIDYVILDEFHHVAAASYKKIIGEIQPKFFLGLTATPFRLDGKDIFKFVDANVAFEWDIERGIKHQLLVPFVYSGLKDNVDYSNIEWLGNKYRQRDLDKKLLIDKRDQQIIKEFKDRIGIGTRKTIAFCNSVKHAYRMNRKFNKAGIPSIAITHKLDRKGRRNLINRFRNANAAQCQILCVRDIYNEGVDFPEVQALLLLRPTFSKTVFVQQLGRGLRIAPNKDNVQVLDFIGNYRNAFKIREWLEEVTPNTEVEIRERETHHRPVKPEYHHRVSKVVFDAEVIDLFEYQKQMQIFQHPSKDQLIANYWEVKKKLGKLERLFHSDLIRKNGSKWSSTTYARVFGSWKKFVESIGEYHVTKEMLIAKAHELMEKNKCKYITFSMWKSAYGQNYLNEIRRSYGKFFNFAKTNNLQRIERCKFCDKECVFKTPKQKYCSDKCGMRQRLGITQFRRP